MRELILHKEIWSYLAAALIIWFVGLQLIKSSAKTRRHRLVLASALILPALLAWPWYSSLVAERRATVLTAIAEHDRVERLDRVQPGEKLPSFNRDTTVLYKRGGRYFLVPKAYAMAAPELAFYWIDGHALPATGSNLHLDNSPGRRSRELMIEIFLHVPDPKSDRTAVRADMEQFAGRNELGPAEQVFPGVIRYNLRRRDAPHDRRAYCVATDSLAPDGLPSVTVCPASDFDDRNGQYGTSFWWSPGVLVSTGMHVSHIKEWPAISREVYRIMSLVQEFKP